MSEPILVYRIGADPIEVSPEHCIFTDRTRIEDGQCLRKRYIRYHLGGLGYVTPGSNEDLVIGGATHEGLDLLLQGGTLEKALAVADDYFWEEISYPDFLLPEQQEALGLDGSHLAKAFIYAFHNAYLPELLMEYEILEVEEEINWLVGETEDNKFIVMMSRPDGVARHRSSRRLWHMSHKTAQDFIPIQLEKFKVDAQRFSESMAIWAKYGEQPEGTLYNYFLKGRRYKDKDLNIDRLSSGLIHPYLNRRGHTGGDLEPEFLSFVYEWQELDGHLLRSRRLTTGWERVSIYNEMDFMTYLRWLEEGLVPRQRDYLKESIVGLNQEYFNPDFAERWRRGIQTNEEEWDLKVSLVEETWDMVQENQHYDREIPLNNSECFAWNRKCPYHRVCWEGDSIESLIEQGVYEPRQPNHLVELSKIIPTE